MPLTSILAAWEKCAKEASGTPRDISRQQFAAWQRTFYPARVLLMIEAIKAAQIVVDAEDGDELFMAKLAALDAALQKLGESK